MTRPQLLGLAAGLVVLVLMLDLVRRRHLREKYAALWLAVAAGVGVLAVFPALLDTVAGWLGVADPPNLLFFAALLVLLVVIVQLSLELSRMEEHIRTLAEEIALLRDRLDGRSPPDEPPA